jgi:hypothetical protein
MLKNTDIRVGNFIGLGKKFNDSNVGQVIEIGNSDRDFEQVLCEGYDWTEWFFKDNYCGIPITDDVHEKVFGCQKNEYLEYTYDISKFDDDKVELVFSGDYLFVRDMTNGPTEQDLITLWNKDLKKEFYVHEFQNLYFFLTGEELKIDIESFERENDEQFKN